MERFSRYTAIKDNTAHNDLEKLAQAALEYLRPWIRSSTGIHSNPDQQMETP